MKAAALGRAGLIPPLLPPLAFLLLAGLWSAGAEPAYRAILTGFGMYPVTPPFLDTQAVLAALECHAKGIDVTVTNPCDIQNRPHVYGSLWLALAPMGLTQAMTAPVAIGLDLTFLAALFALPRARAWREMPVLCLAFLSPVMLLALERANNDILVWLFTLAAARLAIGGAFARAVAYGIAVLSALLKLYPITLLVLLARERFWRAVAIGVPLAAILLTLLWRETGTPRKYFHYTAYHTDAFGAWNIAQSLLASRAETAWRNAAMAAMVAALTAYALTLSVRMIRRFDLFRRVQALPDDVAWLALAASSLLIGCFFAGPSIVYRAILLLLVLPAVLHLWRQAGDRQGARLFAGFAWTIVWCLWSEASHNHVMHWVGGGEVLSDGQLAAIGIVTGLRELAWWWLISALIALAGCIALAAPAGDILRRTRWFQPKG